MFSWLSELFVRKVGPSLKDLKFVDLFSGDRNKVDVPSVVLVLAEDHFEKLYLNYIKEIVVFVPIFLQVFIQ